MYIASAASSALQMSLTFCSTSISAELMVMTHAHEVDSISSSVIVKESWCISLILVTNLAFKMDGYLPQRKYNYLRTVAIGCHVDGEGNGHFR